MKRRGAMERVYLVCSLGRVRVALRRKRRGIEVYGVRVCVAHEDRRRLA